MAEIQTTVKGLQYDFDKQNELYKAACKEAVNEVCERYLDEQSLWNEELPDLIADGTVKDIDDYKTNYLELLPSDIDYSKPFEENLSHPQIQTEIKNVADKYMCNALDLPSSVVVAVDEQYFDNGKPEAYAVRQAVSEKLDIDVPFSYKDASKASPKEIATQKSFDGISRLMKTNDYATFLNLKANINHYSAKNIALIYSQKPETEFVASFSAWKDYYRYPQQGSGLEIWQPSMKYIKTEQQADEYLDYNRAEFPKDSDKYKAEKEKLMQEIEEKGYATRLIGYNLGYTFDISSTVWAGDKVTIQENKGRKSESIDKQIDRYLCYQADAFTSEDREKYKKTDDYNQKKEELKREVKINGKAERTIEDKIDKISDLGKPLTAFMENGEKVAKSVEKAATIIPIAIKGGITQESIYNAVRDYAEKVFSEKPFEVSGIKSNRPSAGALHKSEVLCAAYLMSKHIGLDCENKIGVEMANVFDNSALSDTDILTKGKRNIFAEAFNRGSHLSDQFCKEFDKAYAEKAQSRTVKKQEDKIAPDDR